MTAKKKRGETPEYVRSGARARVALALVGVVVIALAIVPIVVGTRIAEFQAEISDVLQPAVELTSELSLLQTRQLALYQRFLLTDDRTLRPQYRAGVDAENDLYDRIRERIESSDFDARERLAALSAQSARWHVGNQDGFGAVLEPDEDQPPPDRVALGLRSQGSYDELQLATRDLERALRSSVDAQARRMERWRRAQVWLSLGLGFVALVTTLVVARVGRRLRRLNAEAEKRRVEAVRARREIDALLEATGEGVLGIDPQGMCTSLNRRGAEILGYPESEIRGRDVHDTVYHTAPDGTARSREDSPILRALGRNARVESEDGDVLWRRNRTSFPARWSLRPLVDGTDVRGTVLTFADMTEIREKEDALRLAIDQREEVVSIVSHDLRNPLGVVAAASDLLIDLPLSDEERHAQAKIIRRSADRMERLIEDLLDVSNIEAGAFVVRPAAEEPVPILEEAREGFEREAAAADVEVQIGDAVDAAPIRMDRDRVLQALGNLLSNAIRHSPKGGVVTLSAEEIDDDWAALVVTDTGPGIEPESLERLFDRFWQGGERKGKAGLGLAIVRGIADAHGGDVRVESTPGEGATFRLVLPRAPVKVDV